MSTFFDFAIVVVRRALLKWIQETDPTGCLVGEEPAAEQEAELLQQSLRQYGPMVVAAADEADLDSRLLRSLRSPPQSRRAAIEVYKQIIAPLYQKSHSHLKDRLQFCMAQVTLVKTIASAPRKTQGDLMRQNCVDTTVTMAKQEIVNLITGLDDVFNNRLSGKWSGLSVWGYLKDVYRMLCLAAAPNGNPGPGVWKHLSLVAAIIGKQSEPHPAHAWSEHLGTPWPDIWFRLRPRLAEFPEPDGTMHAAIEEHLKAILAGVSMNRQPDGNPIPAALFGGRRPGRPLSDVQSGFIRGRLEEMLSFVSGPNPVGDLGELAGRWAEFVKDMGMALFIAGLAGAVRSNRPATPSHLILVDLNTCDEHARAIINVAVDVAEAKEITAPERLAALQEARRQSQVVGETVEPRPVTVGERAAELMSDDGQIADVLGKYLAVDQGTFNRFLGALKSTVENLLPGKSPKQGRGRSGRPRVEDSPIKKQVYDRIRAEHQDRDGPDATVRLLKRDRQFVEQTEDAGLILDENLVRAALQDSRRKTQKSKPPLD